MKVASRVLLLVALCVLLVGAVTASLAQPASDGLSEQVDAYVTETMHRLPIKGLALAIVKGNQILYARGYGTANARGDPATPQTPWPMASVTKSFTALAVRQLAAAGKVNLGAPLQTYLPEFRLADQQAASRITIRNLIDHTSGISKQEGEQPYLYSPQTTFEQALQHLSLYRPTGQPGGHFEYSNWNYVLLGQVIARASGQPYAEYVQQNILAPLKMSLSTFADFHTLPHAATGNLITYGIAVPYDEAYVPVMVPAAHLTATAEDMAHYLGLLLGKGRYDGRSLLPAGGQGWYDPWWNWHVGRPGSDVVYGFSGGDNSISTSCLLFPQQEVGVVLLLNTRLDAIFSPIQSYDIGLNIGNIVVGRPYALPSNRGFYTTWALYDGLLLLLIAGIIWQVFKLRNWRNQYHAAKRSKHIMAWVGVVFDLLIAIGIFALPTLANTRWNSLIAIRPDFGIPLALTAFCVGAIAFIKACACIRPARSIQHPGR
jgi:CubicO group peptidase (beta-lactamase class C family)